MSANGQPWNRSAAGVIGRLASLALGVWCVSVLAAGLRNPGFTISDPSSAAYGWTTNGTVTVGSGQALIAEDGVHLPVRLSQSFVLSSNVTRIHITLQTLNLSANDPGQPMDAFQISLLDGANNSPVPTTGQDGTSAFFSFQQDGRAYFGSTTTVPGAGASGGVWSPSLPAVITLDVSAFTADTNAVLSFDLLGFDQAGSGVVLAGVRLEGIEPTAVADAVSTLEDVPAVFAVLANDTSNPGTPLNPASVQIVQSPAHGTATINPATGAILYQPATNYAGGDSLTYTVADADGNRSAAGTVSITVVPVNDAPTLTALGDLVMDEDATTRNVNLTGINAGGGETQTLTVTASSSAPAIVPHPAVSYASPSAIGTLSLTPALNASGVVVITVIVGDNGGRDSSGVDAVTNTFTVTVAPVNDPPAFDPVSDAFVRVGQTFNLTLTASDVESPAAALQFELVSGPVGLTVSPAGALAWTVPDPPGAVTNTVTVKVTDDGTPARSATSTFSLIVVLRPVLQITRTESGMLLQWTSTPGFRYQLQATTDITVPAWASVGAETTASGTTMSQLDPDVSAPLKIYRLTVRP
jgi:hypothetical protein